MYLDDYAPYPVNRSTYDDDMPYDDFVEQLRQEYAESGADYFSLSVSVC